ncbi:hypothetical protein AB0901_25190 [Streptomyces roseifaciens]
MFGSVMTDGTAVAFAAALLSPGTVTEERPPPGSVAIEMRMASGRLCGGWGTSVAVAPDNSGKALRGVGAVAGGPCGCGHGALSFAGTGADGCSVVRNLSVRWQP